jgi:DNA-binding NarL/FixJ family response regulator
MPLRIVLAEDHLLVREGVQRLLETEPGFEVVAACGDLDSLLVAVDEGRPDVVITDIRMPPGNSDEGIRIARRLRETNPSVGVVVLSQYASPGYALALLESGSDGRAYLLKERVAERGQLVSAIRAVAAGGSLIDPKVVEGLIAETTRGAASPLRELTQREWDVLRRMAEGMNNASIAVDLAVTERSVEKAINSIFQKLGLTWEPAVHKRVKAVIMYLAESDRDHADRGSQPATRVPSSSPDVRRPPSASARSRTRCSRSSE